MAQFLTLFPALLLLVAAFNPLKTVSSTSGDQSSIADSECSTEYIIDADDCLEKDGETFCSRLRNYPEASHLKHLMKTKYSHLKSYFNEKIVSESFNISSRTLNLDSNQEFMCKSKTRIIYPQAGMSGEYDWMVIVNLPEYKQGISIEECSNEGSECGNDFGMSLSQSYSTECKQFYVYRSMVAYTSGDTIITDEFKMPACCKCVINTH